MLRRLLILLGLILFNALALIAQSKRDYVWLFGYGSEWHEENPIFGGSVMDFNTLPPLTYTDLRDMSFEKTSASICDEAGNLLLYTNGNYLANAQGDTIANSNWLLTQQEAVGATNALGIPQGALLLPLPDSDHEFVLIHEAIKIIPANPPITNSIGVGCSPLYETRIDLSLNSNAGAVTLKRDTLLNAVLDYGKLTAVRHANGRDWWIAIPGHNSELIYRFLLSPEGVQAYPPQAVGITLWNGFGQAVFSPDGNKYAHMSLHKQVENYLNILDFDRCTGLFSNPVQIFYPDNAAAGGVAISPNSRYLYLSSYLYVYQFDLHAENIGATQDTIAIYDGYIKPIPGTEFQIPTRFFAAQLAPDGKIYISTTSAVRSLHVINYPDLPGSACEIVQRGVMLPTLNQFGLPNFPYFRLGPLSGSGCDTLGPVAAFLHTAVGLEFDFQDASLKNPTTWQWDFGDSQTSVEQNPQHTYATEGTYPVCLRVSNAYGMDTLCQEIVVVSTGIAETIAGSRVRVYPNPAKGLATLEIHLDLSRFTLYDAIGRPVWQRYDLIAGQYALDLQGLTSGIYYYEAHSAGNHTESGKLVILPE